MTILRLTVIRTLLIQQTNIEVVEIDVLKLNSKVDTRPRVIKILSRENNKKESSFCQDCAQVNNAISRSSSHEVFHG